MERLRRSGYISATFHPAEGDRSGGVSSVPLERPERVSLALALGLAASRLEDRSDDPEVAAVMDELGRVADLLRERLQASRPDDADDADISVQ